ncbi:MAG: hypothetical protein IPK16_10720 [Anaerolineales bacterium]|nr:hypothetical protein [Anaerolineales bacterium]
MPTVNGGVAVRFEIEHGQGRITVVREGAARPWQILLVGMDAVAGVDHGVAALKVGSVLIKVNSGVDKLEITL